MMNVRLIKTDNLSKVTKMAMDCFNTMSDQEFMNKFSTTKAVYLKRVIKYGDPYMNAPLAKFGKAINRILRG